MSRGQIAAIVGLVALVGAQSGTTAQAAEVSLVTPAASDTSVLLELADQNPGQMQALSSTRGIDASERATKLAAAGPSAATRAEVVRRALALGLTVAAANDFSVKVSGPSSLMNVLFGRQLVNRATALSGTSTAAGAVVPLAFAGLVSSAISSDQSHLKMHPMSIVNPRVTSPAAIGASEVDGVRARALYGAPASTGAYTSRKLTIATIQFSGWDSSALALFAAAQLPGLPNPITSGQYVGINASGDPTTPDGVGGDVEVALDQESLLSVAPQANQRAYFVNNNYTSDFVGALNQIATDALNTKPTITALSISWGGCEAVSGIGLFGSADISALDAAFANVTAAGVTVFAASGDAGAFDCNRPAGTAPSTLSVDYPGSSPHVISVGGLTTQSLTTPTTPTESVWWDGTSGGGGGQSDYESRPAYQPNSTSIAGGGRLVPDIALSADPYNGYFVIGTTDTGPNGCSTGWCRVGGTSLASPLAAATMTDVQIAAGAGSNAQWGEIAPLLYAAQSSPGAFRDITVGGNGGFSATTGYDLASGLGAPNWAGIWWSAQLPLNTKAVRFPSYTRASNVFANVPDAPIIPGLTGIGYRAGTGTPPVDLASGWSSTKPMGLAGAAGVSNVWLQYLYSDHITHLTISGSTFLDDVAPVVALRAALAPSTGTTLQLKWAGSDAGSGIGVFAAYVYRNGVASPVTSYVGTSTSKAIPLVRGATYTIHLYAIDLAGNRSAAATSSIAVPLSPASYRYSSGWLARSTPLSIGNIRYDASRAGATATLIYTARNFQVLATKCVSCGIANIYVDGRLRASVSTYSAATRYVASVAAFAFPTAGRHTIVVQVTGKRIAASRGTAIILNGLLATN